MIEFDYSVIQSLVSALKAALQAVDVYHFVPTGAPMPYVSVELTHIGSGNGMPSPHFRCRMEVELKVWSAYQGMKELQDIVQKMVRFLERRTLPLLEGVMNVKVKDMRMTGQQDSKSQQVRCAVIGLVVYIHA